MLVRLMAFSFTHRCAGGEVHTSKPDSKINKYIEMPMHANVHAYSTCTYMSGKKKYMSTTTNKESENEANVKFRQLNKSKMGLSENSTFVPKRNLHSHTDFFSY